MLRHYMQIWQLSHRSKQFSVRNNNIMKISIRKWLNRIQCATSKCKIAYRFRERHEIQIAFTRFKNEYDRRQHYNEGLEERGDQLIKRKSFKIFYIHLNFENCCEMYSLEMNTTHSENIWKYGKGAPIKLS